MTNHSYLYIKNVSLKQIAEDIKEINTRKFYGKLNIEYQTAPSKWDKREKSDVIYISLKDDNLGIWINEEDILEIRNQGYEAFKWIGYIIETELSVKYDAFKGGDGEKWKGDLSKYNTYYEYLFMGCTKKKLLRKIRVKTLIKEAAEYYDCKAFTDMEE